MSDLENPTESEFPFLLETHEEVKPSLCLWFLQVVVCEWIFLDGNMATSNSKESHLRHHRHLYSDLKWPEFFYITSSRPKHLFYSLEPPILKPQQEDGHLLQQYQRNIILQGCCHCFQSLPVGFLPRLQQHDTISSTACDDC